MKDLRLEDYLELPIKVLENSNKYKTALLGTSHIKEHYTHDLKKQILKKFESFNNKKYTLNYFNRIKIPSYEKVVISTSNTNKDLVSTCVIEIEENKEWLESFYSHIINLSYKLTNSEAVYLNGAFFENSTEERISEDLGISRSNLQTIKKSCLLKTYLELTNSI